MHTSIAVPNTIEFLDIKRINPLISKCKIKVCYVGDTPNRNRSIITEEVAREIAQSLPGSPIVGYFNEGKGDFEEHNDIFQIKNGKIYATTNTRPYGFVDVNAKVWFEEYLDDSVVYRKYLVTEGYLWTGQYPEAKTILQKNRNDFCCLCCSIMLVLSYYSKNRCYKTLYYFANLDFEHKYIC